MARSSAPAPKQVRAAGTCGPPVGQKQAPAGLCCLIEAAVRLLRRETTSYAWLDRQRRQHQAPSRCTRRQPSGRSVWRPLLVDSPQRLLQPRARALLSAIARIVFGTASTGDAFLGGWEPALVEQSVRPSRLAGCRVRVRPRSSGEPAASPAARNV